ncbi:hypothetical protein [Dyella flagellata]|uniref:DUF3828 domain-containing protein n=1 Tax=Dyella flagellata TaxID=1867833 RepID=A0ABQ5XG78_9GAMM|nr:hypothetical protein [Dyella flagellata]GLQ90226.1 hypothetical protein GCM10007898_38010 [Dyella flagellata]
MYKILTTFAAAALALAWGLNAWAAEPMPHGAAALVTQVYRDYAWQAIIEEPADAGADLFDQPPQVLGRYFDSHLVELIVRDHQCRERTHEVCRLDFAPLWDSQDPGAVGMKIRATSDPSKVSVDFAYPAQSTRVHIVYVLSQTPAGWRITDIQGHDWSLRKLLEAKLDP